MNAELRVAHFVGPDGHNTVVPVLGKNLFVWVVTQAKHLQAS